LERASLAPALDVGAEDVAGISEARVQKLLAARGDALAAQIALVARRLTQERALPYRALGRLVLPATTHGNLR
jgi:hypothetical protein